MPPHPPPWSRRRADRAAAVPAPELLGRVGAELADLAATVERLHVLAGAPAASDPAYVRAVQSLDAVEQTLRNLAGFLAALAPPCPPARRSTPARRSPPSPSPTSPPASPATPTAPAHTHGDCELF